MPESGDLPRKSRNNASSNRPSRLEATSREQLSDFRQPPSGQNRSMQSSTTPERQRGKHGSLGRSAARERGAQPKRGDHLNLWQLLFGQDSRRTRAGHDQAATQPQVKQASFAIAEPPTEVLKSFRSNRKRVDAALKTANSAIAGSNGQKPVDRSRHRASRLSSQDEVTTRLDSSANASSRQGQISRAALRSQSRTVLQSRTSTVLQPSYPTNRDLSDLAQRREARGRTGRLGVGERGNTQDALRDQQQTLLPETAKPSIKQRSSTQPRRRETSRSRHRGVSVALYAARMLILSVGIGVLAGTMLSVWDPAQRSPIGISSQAKQASVAGSTNQTSPDEQLPKLSAEIAPLKAAIQTLSAQTPQVAPGVFLLDLDTNDYVDLNGGATLSAASTIKVPILVAFLQDVDTGKIRLDELLTMRRELIGGGSGEMQYQAPGTQFTALETITKMIEISDNTATNMAIARLGGIAALNQRFKSWGMTTTGLNNLLPDLDGTNTTSSKDMTLLLARISQGELLSLRSRDRMLEIMQKTVTDTLLPRGLDEGATIAHKTGDIGTLVGDVGIIDMPNGKRYAAAVLVKRSFNDDRGQELIRQISRLTYQHFNRPVGTVQPVPAKDPSTEQPPESNTETLQRPTDTPTNSRSASTW